jgi:hypothetical protein
MCAAVCVSLYTAIIKSYTEIKVVNVSKSDFFKYIEFKYIQVNTVNPVTNPSGSIAVKGKAIAETVQKQADYKSNHLVVSTIFWVGESATDDNGYIANNMSAWDGNWQSNYGGVDDPAVRSNYYPASFLPKENPFYIALSYNDIDESGSRKATAYKCQKYSPNPSSNNSWCKNTWVKIVSNNGEAYAQWEDVGPYLEDEVAYVFGEGQARNTFGSSAGIDVSPAVAKYLKLTDVDVVYWEFVSHQDVKQGPWNDIITTNRGYSIN